MHYVYVSNSDEGASEEYRPSLFILRENLEMFNLLAQAPVCRMTSEMLGWNRFGWWTHDGELCFASARSSTLTTFKFSQAGHLAANENEDHLEGGRLWVPVYQWTRLKCPLSAAYARTTVFQDGRALSRDEKVEGAWMIF